MQLRLFNGLSVCLCINGGSPDPTLAGNFFDSKALAVLCPPRVVTVVW